jgi:hypothetical protein
MESNRLLVDSLARQKVEALLKSKIQTKTRSRFLVDQQFWVRRLCNLASCSLEITPPFAKVRGREEAAKEKKLKLSFKCMRIFGILLNQLKVLNIPPRRVGLL